MVKLENPGPSSSKSYKKKIIKTEEEDPQVQLTEYINKVGSINIRTMDQVVEDVKR